VRQALSGGVSRKNTSSQEWCRKSYAEKIIGSPCVATIDAVLCRWSQLSSVDRSNRISPGRDFLQHRDCTIHLKTSHCASVYWRVVWVAAFLMLPFSFWFIIAVCQAGQGLLQSWLCLGLVHLSKSYDSSSNAFQLKLLNKFQRLPIFPLHSATARKPDICCWGLRQNGVQPVWRVVVYSGLTLNCSMYIFVLSPNCPLSAVQNLSHL